MSILRCENLTHIYGKGTPFEHVALDSVSFAMERGEFVALIGHTGSGKSTLIQHLNGLLKPDGGAVYFDEKNIWDEKSDVRKVRFKVGLVFQYPEYQLFEETVGKDIAFGPKNMGLAEDELKERVREAASFVGIDEELLEKSPFELSGGQRRRVAIAGIIAMRPEALILDEPTAGLDPRGRDEILSRIAEYRSNTGSAVLLVTHSMEDAARYAERLVVMNGAHVFMQGTPAEVFSRAEELQSAGLAVPQITRVCMRLRELGVDIDPATYTVEEAVRQLTRLKNGAAGGVPNA